MIVRAQVLDQTKRCLLSFSFLFESYRGTWVATSKSKKNRSVSNQVGNAFQTLFFTDFATDSQNSRKR